MRFFVFVLVCSYCFLFSAASYADCVSPSGVETQTNYDFTSHELRYCNGSDWIVMDGGGGGGASLLDVIAYVIFSDTSGSPTVHVSENLSISHISGGEYRLTFDAPLPDTNYIVTGLSTYEGNAAFDISFSNTIEKTASSFDIMCWHGAGGQRKCGNNANIIVYH